MILVSRLAVDRRLPSVFRTPVFITGAVYFALTISSNSRHSFLERPVC